MLPQQLELQLRLNAKVLLYICIGAPDFNSYDKRYVEAFCTKRFIINAVFNHESGRDNG